MGTKRSFLDVLIVLLLSWPGALTLPSLQQDINQNSVDRISLTGHLEKSVEMATFDDWPGMIQIEGNNESTIDNVDSCDQFLAKVDSYLAGKTMMLDFQQGKPTLLMILRKIFPDFSLEIDHIGTMEIRKMVVKQFCPGIRFNHYLVQKMGTISRNIAKIWKSKNIKEVMESMKEIGEDLTTTINILGEKLDETEKFYTEDLINLYKATTVIGPEVAKTIKAIGKIENEAKKIRWALKSLGKTTVRRSDKIIRYLQKLTNGTTSKEVDMKRMLMYTANLLKTSHGKLEESIKSYDRMRTELDALVVDLKMYDTEITKISSDVESEYRRKKNGGIIKLVFASIGTIISVATSAVGLSDGSFGAADVIGPTALAGSITGLVYDSIGMDNLREVNSAIESTLAHISQGIQRYLHSSTELQLVLKFEEESAREWYDIVKDIQDDFGEDLAILEEDLENTEEYIDDLMDAKNMFSTLKEQAQAFLDILAKNEKTTEAIHRQFKSKQN